MLETKRLFRPVHRGQSKAKLVEIHNTCQTGFSCFWPYDFLEQLSSHSFKYKTVRKNINKTQLSKLVKQVFHGSEGQRGWVRLYGDPRQGHVEKTRHRSLHSSGLANDRILHVSLLVNLYLKGWAWRGGICSLGMCCVFWPAFGCCVHPKAGRNTFFSYFQPFLYLFHQDSGNNSTWYCFS